MTFQNAAEIEARAINALIAAQWFEDLNLAFVSKSTDREVLDWLLEENYIEEVSFYYWSGTQFAYAVTPHGAEAAE